ncbi:MAG: hypothetical protein BWK75_07040 [Candidatus Altiarchaeales archaeon A3]|nr:MAG: hypothetical protein BWK75_07040 [Candidatus Altiarchaeales archaeon A3]
MKNNPVVSVVIPTYNKVRYLKEAIESVLNQTYLNRDVIVVDDGSTDNTAEIVKSFNDPRIIYSWHENKGAAAARNTGIKNAHGKYVAFIDSDDLWLKEKLEKQVDFMEKNPDIGLLGTGSYEITDEGKIWSKKIFPTDNKILQKDLIKYNPFIQTSIMAKREVFDKAGLYDKTFQESEDYELWLRIAKYYKIANLPEPLVMKRYYGDCLSPAKDKKQLYFVLKAKKIAVDRGQYPKWCYIYLIRSWIFIKIPFSWRKIIRIYLLKKRFYNVPGRHSAGK